MKTIDYQKQGTDFLAATNTEMKVEYVGNDYHFDGDKEKRDIYRITLKRNGREYSFRFGQSLANSGVLSPFREGCVKCKNGNYSREEHRAEHGRKPPTAYDVLTCLHKWDVGTIDNFAAEFGYQGEKPSKIMKIYSAVVEEYEGVRRLFGDVMDKLGEIQ